LGDLVLKYTSRERIVTSLEHREPDRVPISFGGLHDSIHLYGHRKLKNYLELKGGENSIQDPFQQIVFPDERLIAMFGSDIVPVYAKPAAPFTVEFKDEGANSTYMDEWGTKYRKPKDSGLYYDFERNIFSGKSLSEIISHRFPDPSHPSRFEGLREKVQKLYNESDKAIVAYAPSGGVFEHTYWLRGIEDTFNDMVENIKLLDVLTDKILEWMLDFWEAYLEEIGDLVQVVQVGDDLGGQYGPLFSPKLYRSIYKPKEGKLISCIRKHTNAKVYFHSCGAISDFIPDLIDIGVEVLNPVQVQAANMGSGKLKREFGNDLSFWGGGADPVAVLSGGSPDDVRNEVKSRIEDVKTGGGYVFASIHNIQADAVFVKIVVALTDPIKHSLSHRDKPLLYALKDSE
jgi:uroporphyrinogen decarboxylase